MNNLQEIAALWDKYHQTIAVDTMEYDRELRQLLFANSNVCDVSNANIEELISKRQAIDAAIEAVDGWDGVCNIGRQKRIENYIKQLPSAQPEPKRGKWVDDGDPLMLTCGNCGYAVMRYNNTPFCPNCGADMRGERDG